MPRILRGTATNNLLSLLIFISVSDHVAPRPVYQPAFIGRNIRETNFLFHLTRSALIDGVLLTGLDSFQIR
jgi:hypothetical protein